MKKVKWMCILLSLLCVCSACAQSMEPSDSKNDINELTKEINSIKGELDLLKKEVDDIKTEYQEGNPNGNEADVTSYESNGIFYQNDTKEQISKNYKDVSSISLLYDFDTKTKGCTGSYFQLRLYEDHCNFYCMDVETDKEILGDFSIDIFSNMLSMIYKDAMDEYIPQVDENGMLVYEIIDVAVSLHGTFGTVYLIPPGNIEDVIMEFERLRNLSENTSKGNASTDLSYEKIAEQLSIEYVLGEVNSEVVKVRDAASSNANVLNLVNFGDEMLILSEENGYYHVIIILENTKTEGYVSKEYVDIQTD